jgi:DNA-3-methyladenine glycosylase
MPPMVAWTIVITLAAKSSFINGLTQHLILPLTTILMNIRTITKHGTKSGVPVPASDILKDLWVPALHANTAVKLTVHHQKNKNLTLNNSDYLLHTLKRSLKRSITKQNRGNYSQHTYTHRAAFLWHNTRSYCNEHILFCRTQNMNIGMPILLTPDFFNRNTITVARELLGKMLVVQTTQGPVAHMLTEVEAYDGPHDRACHGRFGKTKRTAPLFGPAGHWYVYRIYGMYWMLNIVTGPIDYPAAVLIRSVQKISGPGRLTKQLNITDRFNTQTALPHSNMWIEDHGIVLPKHAIEQTPRIGINYAGKIWSQKPYRFVVSNSPLLD